MSGDCSVTKRLHYVFNFGQFKTIKFHPIAHIVCSKICPKLKKPYKNCPSLIKFCQSGKISSDLVTLRLSEWASVHISSLSRDRGISFETIKTTTTTGQETFFIRDLVLEMGQNHRERSIHIERAWSCTCYSVTLK